MVDNEDGMREDCSCGRSAKKVHCPHCGSYVVVGYAKRETVDRSGGVLEQIRAYRCRRCAEIFNDDKWKNECHAAEPRLERPRKATIEQLFKQASLDGQATLAEQAAALRMLINNGKMTNPCPALRSVSARTADWLEEIRKRQDEGKR